MRPHCTSNQCCHRGPYSAMPSSLGARIACPIALSMRIKSGFAIALSKSEKRIFNSFAKKLSALVFRPKTPISCTTYSMNGAYVPQLPVTSVVLVLENGRAPPSPFYCEIILWTWCSSKPMARCPDPRFSLLNAPHRIQSLWKPRDGRGQRSYPGRRLALPAFAAEAADSAE